MLPVTEYARTPPSLVLGLATSAHSVAVVGGQGRDLLLIGRGTPRLERSYSGGKGLRAVCLRGDAEIWTCGEYGHVSRSTDGGLSFRKLDTGGTDACLFGLVEDADGAVWVCGERHYLARSEDGETLTRVGGISGRLNRMFASTLGVMVPTSNGNLYLTEGKGVRKTGLEAGVMLHAATQTPAGTLLVVGDAGHVWRSTDRGETWARVALDTDANIEGVAACGDRVIICGDGGLLRASDDEGETFTPLEHDLGADTLWCAEAFGDAGCLVGGNARVGLVGEAPTLEPAPAIPDDEDPEDLDRPAHWRAPPPSTTLPSWDPAPLPETSKENGVFVSPWLRAHLHPRRGGIDTRPRPLPTVDEAWGGLRAALFAGDRAGMQAKPRASGIWERRTSSNPASRRLAERILDPTPRAGSEAEDVALARLSLAKYGSFIADAHDLVWAHLCDFLVASHGLAEASRRLLMGLDDELPYTGVGPFARLRELLAIAADDDYAAARDALLAQLPEELAKAQGDRDRTSDLKWTATYLLPLGPAAGDEERELHEQAMAHVTKFGNFGVHASGLAAGDLDTLQRFLDANGGVRHEFFAAGYLTGVLEMAGAACGPVLARMKPSSPWQNDHAKNHAWLQLVAHVDHPDCRARILAEHREGHAWGTEALRLAYSLDPDGVRAIAGDDAAVDGPPRPIPEEKRELARVGRRGTPMPYTPPARVLIDEELPEGAPAPELRWRQAEREAATPLGVAPDREKWDETPIAYLEDDELEAFIAHRERWAIPTRFEDLALAPPAIHARLRALGFRLERYWASLLPSLLLRGGAAQLPILLASLDDESCFEAALEAAQPVGDVRVGLRVIPAFGGKKHKAAARTWMLRHPAHAAAAARLLGQSEDKKTREAAARGLRFIDPSDTSLDPLLKRKKVKLPAWAEPSKLPKLPNAGALLEALARSTADEPEPEVALARDNLDEKARADFAWALFEAWLQSGASNKESWALQAVGFLGDDACAEKLSRLALAWPHEGQSARAKAALDVLLNLGSEKALGLLFHISQHAGPAGLRAAASERIDELAVRLGLSADELAERMTPTLGLEDEANLVYDLGGRTLQLRFGPELEPLFEEEGGRLIPKLPRPNKTDDKAKVKAAKAKLKALEKAMAPLRDEPVPRLERLLRSGREIPAAVFTAAYVEHPWLKHLAARFVWSDGAPFLLGERAPTGLVHLLHPAEIDEDARDALLEQLGEDRAPPFPQLDRPVFDRDDLGDALGEPLDDEVAPALIRFGWHALHDEGDRCLAAPFGDIRVVVRTGEPRGTPDALSPREISELTWDLERAYDGEYDEA